MQQDNKYVIIFTIVMTVLSSLAITGSFVGFKPFHDANESVFIKKEILKSVENILPKKINEYSDEEIVSLFEKNIKAVIVKSDGTIQEGDASKLNVKLEYTKPLESRVLPVYIYTDGAKSYQIFSISGKGLWDAIWASVALSNDMQSIAGITFDHVGETPGLGAEIRDNPAFAKSFLGKKIFDKNANYKSVLVQKNVDKSLPVEYQNIDAISGATVTSVGVSDMMYNGLAFYLPYIKNQLKQ